MRTKPLAIRKLNASRRNPPKTVCITFNGSCTLHKVNNTKARREFCRSRSRQNMVWARYIVPDRLGCMAAKEDRTGMPYFGRPNPWICDSKLKMLSRNLICQCWHHIKRRHRNDGTIVPP
jgi:hypothetical protein